MDIDFLKNDFIVYGGGLIEPFQYFGRIISDKLKQEKIDFPVKEFEINLVNISSLTKVEQEEYCSKLPYYYRGKNMISLVLLVLEAEKTVENVFQFFYNAFDILFAKKKKNDNYDVEKVRQILTVLELELKNVDLLKLNKQYDIIFREENLAKRIFEREERRNRIVENKRLIKDVRFYPCFKSVHEAYFKFYDKEFCCKILIKLRERKFKLPDYTHLYIKVSDSFENALLETITSESWYICGVAVLDDFVNYSNKTQLQQKRIIFNLISEGLNDIAAIDKLDIHVLNVVLKEVENETFL
ncbi:hypothetical protein [Flavobacterium johnsoniae]|uniref:Uncharacterized protein n=1 Tax=Flavobacterium johnsoniae (strain ATCC 17061 / DSM 2064 / JCM 8514 / BCRC 14874 / CCUG 350202 / NBRC 14942 / NCIMB 11054 / UW101) TaxID=376686 RepID=A5FM70_FLAJ1|nr:hypothetical protein [Flavobacterium johnsoniae]ABQ03697.1 hypothetical protein Fjoh_0662 [Flavobacterium johnsoniae UW101]OXG03221.1 hypothetical protein B0A63_00160 [Flavobacterium johnsoniae UW101]WQG79441.1 hypothetical protein SR927_15565 [Flavobacterium johnsoniae UW101]SHK00061.1 hypothetical protein SAMN05444146_0061 [Flavobacterium johnsoniae]